MLELVRAFCGWGEARAGQVCHLPGSKVDAAVRNVDLSCTVVWVSPDKVKFWGFVVCGRALVCKCVCTGEAGDVCFPCPKSREQQQLPWYLL